MDNLHTVYTRPVIVVILKEKHLFVPSVFFLRGGWGMRVKDQIYPGKSGLLKNCEIIVIMIMQYALSIY